MASVAAPLHQAVIIAAAAAVLSHYAFWCRYEFDGYAHYIVIGFLVIQPLLLINLYYHVPSLKQSMLILVVAEPVYWTVLFVSIGVYRLFLHGLARFQGPFWARLSTIWKINLFAKREKAYLDIYDLHQKYGDVVRIGPRELSIRHIEAVESIYGGKSLCLKAPSYEMGQHESVQVIRDPKKHHYRRGIWDKGLNARACQQFIPRMNRISDLFVQRMKEYGGNPVVINEWIHFVTFDTREICIFHSKIVPVADLAFGKSYGQLESGKIHHGVALIKQWLNLFVYMMQVPWLMVFLSHCPGVDDPMTTLRNFARASLRERETNESDQPDVMSHIINEKGASSRWPLNDADLISDTMTLQVAGSDTSSSSIMHMLYYMAKQPEIQRQLYHDLQQLTSDNGDSPSWSSLNALPLLEAVITETLRMHPPVPQGMQRNTPRRPTFTLIAGQPIPADTIVSVPTYSVQHDPRYFVSSDEWLPERWITEPDMVIDKRAFFPFSVGPFNCAGKAFAMMEMKIFMARVVSNLRIEFAPREDGIDMMTKQKDYMTWQCPDLRLCFKPRDGAVAPA